MNRVDEILAAIDTGLQTAGDTAYGNDFDGTCWRCRVLCDTDLCAYCRAELVAEEAPALPKYVTVWISVDASQALAACERVLDQFPQLPPSFRHQILADVLADIGDGRICAYPARSNPQGDHP